MSDDLDQLTAMAEAMIGAMSAEQRRRATRMMATDLRRLQSDRIAAQLNPDGTPYEPRKPRSRVHHKVAGRAKARGGQVSRKAMFAKLRTARFLRAKSDANGLEVGFNGRAAQIARVHQEGLRDKVDPRNSTVETTYPIRRLLGLADGDREKLLERVAAMLEAGSR